MTVTLNSNEYESEGYLTGLPVFEEHEVNQLGELYDRLCGLLPPGETAAAIDWWHQLDLELYKLCMNRTILDYVEQILGPDFYLWGSQFFSKEPGQGTTVPWHQDGYYWPLTPPHSLTVWLAFADSFKENGAMMVVPKTHKTRITHLTSDRQTDVLNLAADTSSFDDSKAVVLALKAGQCSIHNDNIVHGSEGNTSDTRRCGLTIRFSAGEVRCDTSEWPFFKSYWARGIDKWNHNPEGIPPETNLTQFKSVTPRTGQKK